MLERNEALMPSRMDLYHQDPEPESSRSVSRSSEPQTRSERLSRSAQLMQPGHPRQQADEPQSREQLREAQLTPAPKLKKIPPILKPSALLAIALLTVGLMGTLGHKSYSVNSKIVQTEKHHDRDTDIDSTNLSRDDDEHSHSTSEKKHSKSSSDKDKDKDKDSSSDDASINVDTDGNDTDTSNTDDGDTQQQTQTPSRSHQTQSNTRQSSQPTRHQSQSNNNQSTYQTGGNSSYAQNNGGTSSANDNQDTYTVPNQGGDTQ